MIFLLQHGIFMNQPVTFEHLELSETLLKALSAMNFVTPSPIQAQTIPHLLQGKDLIGQAQTGTGKTAAFALPILQKIQPNSPLTQALILAPTRELAIQVAEQFAALAANQGITVCVLCGGQDYRRQLTQLKEGAQIVVGTPGRTLDHIERKSLTLHGLKTFVLDEADEMLRMGFIEDVEAILSRLPEKRQIALFSATMPSRIRNIAVRYLVDPISVEIRAETATVKSGRASGGRSYCPDVGRSCKTPAGTFYIQSKGGAGCRSSRYPVGKGGAKMPYCMFFSRYYAVHGSYDVPPRNASHGCIRVTPSDALWLHRNFMDIGTKVIVKPY